MRENREVFKKARLPVHDDCTSDSDDQDMKTNQENKPMKKLEANVKLQRKSSKYHSHRHTQNRKRESSATHKRRKTRQQPERACAKKVLKMEERRSFINSKNRLTMGLYNQGKQSQTIYREPGLSKVFEKMSQKLKDKTKEDMSKVLDCSSFQIKPLQACITETTSDDFIYPGSESSHHSQKDPIWNVDLEQRTSSSVGSACNSVNESTVVDEMHAEKMEVDSEPQLEDISQRLMGSLEPRVTFGKNHLQDIRNELKQYYRKSTLQQDYCDGHTLLDTLNHSNTTPVRINKIPNAGKKLFPSSISRIATLQRDLGDSSEDLRQKNYGNSNSHVHQEDVLRYTKTSDDEYTTKQQSDRAQHVQDIKHSHDILSIIDEQCTNAFEDVSKYAQISPLKKPSLDIPSPPDKLLPRKLF